MPAKPYKNSSLAETSVEELVMEIHRIHPELLERQVRVLVVGCGGTGSAVVAGLPYLHQSLMAHGHPGGLHVTVMDGDTISPTNCVRQPFARSEIGLNKAIVLVNRLNLFWGLKWEAVPAHLQPGTFISRSYSGDDLRAHIVIGCVDTRAARATIRDAVGKWSTVSYWLDLGNNADSGQFILGEPLNERNRRSKLRLRTAAELYPEIGDPTLDNDGEPSCSAVECPGATRSHLSTRPLPNTPWPCWPDCFDTAKSAIMVASLTWQRARPPCSGSTRSAGNAPGD